MNNRTDNNINAWVIIGAVAAICCAVIFYYLAEAVFQWMDAIK